MLLPSSLLILANTSHQPQNQDDLPFTLGTRVSAGKRCAVSLLSSRSRSAVPRRSPAELSQSRLALNSTGLSVFFCYRLHSYIWPLHIKPYNSIWAALKYKKRAR
jgi:hypothetical protein